MRTISQYLDDLKEKTGSDYKSAKELNIRNSVLCTIRKRNAVSEETAIKIADALGIERKEVLLAAMIARSEGEVKSEWEKISRQAGIAVSLFLIITTSNYIIEKQKISINDTIHYAQY